MFTAEKGLGMDNLQWEDLQNIAQLVRVKHLLDFLYIFHNASHFICRYLSSAYGYLPYAQPLCRLFL